jgi:hypothetical protein
MIATRGSVVWLYGSVAGGRADELSDIDVLVVSGEVALSEGLMPRLAGEGRVSVSAYSWHEIEQMAHQGSLFLVHLRQEGRPLFESADSAGRLQTLLNHLGPYRRVEKDIRSFELTLADVRESLKNDGSAIWELSVLATLVRNASILGCYLLGQPTFGRTEPIFRVASTLEFSSDDAELLASMSSYQMHAVGRGIRPPVPNVRQVQQLVSLSDELVGRLKEVDYGQRARMLVTA